MNLFDWLWLVSAVAVGIACLMLYWSLFHDRSRGRPRCPCCWYSMEGASGLTCPECGATARSTRMFLKTRRRWRWALVSLVLLSTVSISIKRLVNRYGVWNLMPTFVVVEMMPPAGIKPEPFPQSHPVELAFWRRHKAGALSSRHLDRYCRRAGYVEFPERWPRGVPLTVRSTLSYTQFDLVLLLRDPNTPGPPLYKMHPLAMVEQWNGLPYFERTYQQIGTVDAGGVASLDLELARTTGFAVANSATIWRGTIKQRIELVDTVDEIMTPVSGSEIDAAVSKAIKLRVSIGMFGSDPESDEGVLLTVFSGLDRTLDPRLSDVAIGFEVALLREGEVVAVVPFSADLFENESEPEWYRETWLTLRSTLISEPEVLHGSRQWSLQVRGVPELAVTAWNYPSYWAGEFEISVAPPPDGKVEREDWSWWVFNEIPRN